jgi:predicted helicase
VDTDRDRLLARLQAYFDPDVSHTEMRHLNSGVMEDTARFKGEAVRDTLRKRGFLPDNIVRYCYRPFDTRWLYWEPETKLLDEKRSEYLPHVFNGNIALVAQQKPRREWQPPQTIGALGCIDLMDRSASCFPLYLHSDGTSLLEPAGKRPNLSDAAAAYLTGMAAGPEDLFYHALAILHAPAYRVGNAGALRQDWPRIPLPAAKEALLASAALGRQVAALLDTETPVAGVTVQTGEKRSMFNSQGGEPDAEDNLRVESCAVKVERFLDVFLNDTTCWRNVPVPVWEYTIGGYQVIKKWLSYREKPLLGRGLTVAEVRTVTETCRRIAALLALQSALDANYRTVTAEP